MTQNSLFSKSAVKQNRTAGKRSLWRHTVGSYWWLMFACGIVYFFAGPVFTLLYLNGMNFDDSNINYLPGELLQRNIETMSRWMSAEGMLPLYLSAVVLSMILGCVMFSYLQHKRQVNFYHSQPIHRTRLFLNRFVFGYVMNMVLMVLMLCFSLLMIVMYGLGDALSLSAVLRHVWHMAILSLASYSISVLAGQLTGTVLTHLAIMLVLHFSVPAAMLIISYIGEIFFATFNTSYPLAALNFSPFCAMIMLLTGYSTRYLKMMTAPAMSTSMLMTLLVIGIGFAILSWWLYQKRPSEATGKSLIYPITEPVVKSYLMFVGALAGGFIFYSVGDKAFFYFGVIVFAILIHMVCEVIIQHDFKAIFRKLNHCAVILVMICAVVGVARFDLLGFDRYLPHPDKVSEVTFRLHSVDDFYAAPRATSDAQVKQQVHDLLEPIIDNKWYRSSRFNGYGDWYLTNFDSVDASSISVIYKLNNGREVTRYYRAVPIEVIKEDYAALYNMEAYRESCYGEILRADFDRVVYLNIEDYTLYSPKLDDVRDTLVETTYPTAVVYEYETVGYDTKQIATDIIRNSGVHGDLPTPESREARELAQTLFAAYQRDLMDRQFSALEEVTQYSINVQLLQEGSSYAERGYSSYHYTLPVYASDERTMAILNQYNFKAFRNTYNYDKLLIFRCEATAENELREALSDALSSSETGLFTEAELIAAVQKENDAVVTGKLEGEKAINQFIAETNLLRSSGMFSTFDETHFVMLQYNHDIDGTDQMEWRSTLFYADTVPTAFQ